MTTDHSRPHRDRPVLQRLHALPDRHPVALHRLLAQELRGVQQRVSERQARPHRFRHRICLDVGRNSGQSMTPPLVGARVLIRLDLVAAIECSRIQIRYLGAVVVWCRRDSPGLALRPGASFTVFSPLLQVTHLVDSLQRS